MNKWKKAGLIGLGAVLGVLLSINFSVIAQRDAKLPIPYEDLQLLSAVFGRIKSDYVEPVSDEKLIKEAINGMVHGLDPHSDFLDAEARVPAIRYVHAQTPSRTPGGFKGMAEGPAIGAPPAVINAITDALWSRGVRDIEMPATSERVWRAIQGSKQKAKTA